MEEYSASYHLCDEGFQEDIKVWRENKNSDCDYDPCIPTKCEIYTVHYSKNMILHHYDGFTEGKSYEIIAEKYSRRNQTIWYVLNDDNGNKRHIDHRYFYMKEILTWNGLLGEYHELRLQVNNHCRQLESNRIENSNQTLFYTNEDRMLSGILPSKMELFIAVERNIKDFKKYTEKTNTLAEKITSQLEDLRTHLMKD